MAGEDTGQVQNTDYHSSISPSFHLSTNPERKTNRLVGYAPAVRFGIGTQARGFLARRAMDFRTALRNSSFIIKRFCLSSVLVIDTGAPWYPSPADLRSEEVESSDRDLLLSNSISINEAIMHWLAKQPFFLGKFAASWFVGNTMSDHTTVF